MISGPDRENALMLIDEAVESGCRLEKACEGINISERTYWRWKAQTKATGSCEDRRPMSDHSVSNKEINDEIKAEIIEICSQPEYADLTPAEIVPMLADKGIYIASERTFYRVLKEAKMLAHRGRSKKPTEKRAPTTFKAEASNEVWT